MGASHSSEPEITLENTIEPLEPVEPEPEYDGMYDMPEIEMDWFWPFI
jgi:hypothetical protein